MSDRLSSPINDHEQLELQFERQGDRYLHRLSWIRDSEPMLLWSSIEGEGEGEAHWPPSPPLQQLHIESRDGGAVALLVGMAGNTHWSLSAEELPGGAFRFDVACRLRTDSPGWIGSSYRASSEITPGLEFELTGLEGCRASNSLDGRWTLRADANQPSVRWLYTVRHRAE